MYQFVNYDAHKDKKESNAPVTETSQKLTK